MSCYQWRGRQRALACAGNAELVLSLLSLSADCQAADRERMSGAYKLAADSVSKCPLPITSVEEARQLVGIGDFIANRIGHWLSSRQRRAGRRGEEDEEEEAGRQPAAAMLQSDEAEQKEKTRSRSRRFTPSRGTPAYHLLLSLVLSSAPSAALLSSSSSSSSCPALAALSLFSHCATTFQVAEKKVKDALRTLAANGLLERAGDSVDAGSASSVGCVRLTARGSELGQQLLTKWKAAQAGSSSSSSSSSPPHASPSSSPSLSPPPPAASPPPSLTLPSRHPLSGFILTLLIDSRELASHSHSSFSRSLQSSRLHAASRALPIGDFAFIITHAASGTEYTVDCIVERKRVPDLVASVIDGRLTEQRWRMKRTGMHRRCFLIEGRDWDSAADAAASSSSSSSSRRSLSLPGSTLDSVVSGLSVCHGYLVVRVPSSAGSVCFLRELYGRLLREMEAEGVELTEPYSAFEKRMRKRIGGEAESSEAEADREERRKTWGSQLRMIRGVSPMIASAIVAEYGSCRALLDAYDACAGSLRREEALLADLQFGCRRRRLGLGLSRRIRQVLRMRLYQRDEDDKEAEQRAKEEAEERRRRAAEAQEKRERKKRERAEARTQAAGADGKAETATESRGEQVEDDEQPARRRLKSDRKARELEERRRQRLMGDGQDDDDDCEDEWRPEQREEEDDNGDDAELLCQRQRRDDRRRHEQQPDDELEGKEEKEANKQEEEEELVEDEEEEEEAVVEEERRAVDKEVVLVVDDDVACTAALASPLAPIRKKPTAKERMRAARSDKERMRQRLPHSSRDVVELLSEEQEEKEMQWWQEAGEDMLDLTCA